MVGFFPKGRQGTLIPVQISISKLVRFNRCSICTTCALADDRQPATNPAGEQCAVAPLKTQDINNKTARYQLIKEKQPEHSYSSVKQSNTTYTLQDYLITQFLSPRQPTTTTFEPHTAQPKHQQRYFKVYETAARISFAAGGPRRLSSNI